MLNYPKTGVLFASSNREEENLFNLFFKTNLNTKEDFDLIIKIKQKIVESEESLKVLKDSFLPNFKKRFKNMKDNPSSRSQYEAKYNCLFGNGICL